MIETLYFAALFASSDWHFIWWQFHFSKSPWRRKTALHAKARAVVIFDRRLNGKFDD